MYVVLAACAVAVAKAAQHCDAERILNTRHWMPSVSNDC
jgi:hypothetical protein